MKGTNELDFSSPSLRELCQAQQWGSRVLLLGMQGCAGEGRRSQGLGGEEEQAVVTHKVNGSGKAGAPRAAEQSGCEPWLWEAGSQGGTGLAHPTSVSWSAPTTTSLHTDLFLV